MYIKYDELCFCMVFSITMGSAGENVSLTTFPSAQLCKSSLNTANPQCCSESPWNLSVALAVEVKIPKVCHSPDWGEAGKVGPAWLGVGGYGGSSRWAPASGLRHGHCGGRRGRSRHPRRVACIHGNIVKVGRPHGAWRKIGHMIWALFGNPHGLMETSVSCGCFSPTWIHLHSVIWRDAAGLEGVAFHILLLRVCALLAVSAPRTPNTHTHTHHLENIYTYAAEWVGSCEY